MLRGKLVGTGFRFASIIGMMAGVRGDGFKPGNECVSSNVDASFLSGGGAAVFSSGHACIVTRSRSRRWHWSRLTPRTARKLREENPKKWTQAKVAAALGVARSTVESWFTSNDKPVNANNGKAEGLLFDATVDARVKLDPKKWTQAKVAAALGVAQRTVSDWFTTNSGTANASNGRAKAEDLLFDATVDARVKLNPKAKPIIADRVEQGQSQAQIAADQADDGWDQRRWL